jgi:hypothetical protein
MCATVSTAGGSASRPDLLPPSTPEVNQLHTTTLSGRYPQARRSDHETAGGDDDASTAHRKSSQAAYAEHGRTTPRPFRARRQSLLMLAM